MARLVWFPAVCLGLAIVCSAKPIDDVTDIELRMPGVQPTVADTYLCLPMKLGEDATYLTGFVPHGNMTTAHHMLLFGCAEPGNENEVWNCGEMQSKSYEDGAPPCASDPKIIYAWAMDAPTLKLPEGVGFKVGGDTDVEWLVLQVHYKDVSHFIPPENAKDHSGLTLKSTETPQPKRAGVYLLSTGGVIPPHSTTYMEAACGIDDPITIHPFAYRVHAHKHGEVVSGYRVRDGEWTEIGRMSPKKPQMFYNVTTPGITVKSGDILAARCTMVNDEDRAVQVGQTQQDEMCNFYVMYWVPGDHTMAENYCTTAGPPSWYWKSVSTIHVENSPLNASQIPGTDSILRASAKLAQEVDSAFEETKQRLNKNFMNMMNALEDEEPEEDAYLDNAFDDDLFSNGFNDHGSRMFGMGNEQGQFGNEWNPYKEDEEYEPYKGHYYPQY